MRVRATLLSMKDVAVVHYDDIALKGANRGVFEQRLVDNLAKKIEQAQCACTIENRRGRLLVQDAHGIAFEDEQETHLVSILATTPGVATYGIGVATTQELEAIQRAVAYIVHKYCHTFTTFRITTTRTDKNAPYTSQEVDVVTGAHVLEVTDNEKRVQLTNPDIEIRIEILHTCAYVYVKQRGISGLPVGSSGSAVALLSGGFDSPIAAYLGATRGIRPILLHFHARPHTSVAAQEKVEDLARVLRTYCGPLTLILAPLLHAQKEIALHAPEKLRVVLYRRIMMRVAEELAHEKGAEALITGDVVGQVASQTLANISAVESATTLPILRPLCGMHKHKIIAYARAIETHDISVQPHDDTCTVFVPRHPETRARLADIATAEEKFDVNGLVAHILAHLEVHEM